MSACEACEGTGRQDRATSDERPCVECGGDALARVTVVHEFEGNRFFVTLTEEEAEARIEALAAEGVTAWLE